MPLFAALFRHSNPVDRTTGLAKCSLRAACSAKTAVLI